MSRTHVSFPMHEYLEKTILYRVCDERKVYYGKVIRISPNKLAVLIRDVPHGFGGWYLSGDIQIVDVIPE
jgi:ribosomal protein L35AE/L33A